MRGQVDDKRKKQLSVSQSELVVISTNNNNYSSSSSIHPSMYPPIHLPTHPPTWCSSPGSRSSDACRRASPPCLPTYTPPPCTAARPASAWPPSWPGRADHAGTATPPPPSGCDAALNTPYHTHAIHISYHDMA